MPQAAKSPKGLGINKLDKWLWGRFVTGLETEAGYKPAPQEPTKVIFAQALTHAAVP